MPCGDERKDRACLILLSDQTPTEWIVKSGKGEQNISSAKLAGKGELFGMIPGSIRRTRIVGSFVLSGAGHAR